MRSTLRNKVSNNRAMPVAAITSESVRRLREEVGRFLIFAIDSYFQCRSPARASRRRWWIPIAAAVAQPRTALLGAPTIDRRTDHKMSSACQKGGNVRLVEQGSRAVASGIACDNALHHSDEVRLLAVRQIGNRRLMRGARRGFDLAEKGFSRRRQSAEARAAVVLIDGTLDKIACGETLQCSRRCRPIQRDIGCQSGLIGDFSDCESREQAVLQRRHFEPAAGVLEQGDVDLVQPADQEPRTF
jgi:hypothetical protein